jgi:hypothetical protein
LNELDRGLFVSLSESFGVSRSFSGEAFRSFGFPVEYAVSVRDPTEVIGVDGRIDPVLDRPTLAGLHQSVGFELVEVSANVVRPSDPDSYPAGGLSSTVLREIDFRYAAERLRKQLAFHDRWNKADRNYEVKRMDRVRAALAEGITEQYLALLASAYVHRVQRTKRRSADARGDGDPRTNRSHRGLTRRLSEFTYTLLR